ncbi:EAL domain-containing protein [Actinoplanes sp. NPDC051346]|uniref:EAL domain-containing protein n=1 Tax=Actinoplanes sp. NPDC051346 TaxID=3155048 RepID=UPI003417E641
MSTGWTADALRTFIAGRQVRVAGADRRPVPLPDWAGDAVVSPVWTGDLGRVHEADRPQIASAYRSALLEPGTVHEATIRHRGVDQWTPLRLRYLNLLNDPDTNAMVCTVEVAGPPTPIDLSVEVPWLRVDCDGGDRIRVVEGMVEELYGCAAADLIGRDLLTLVHPGDAPACIEAAVQVLNNPGVDQTLTHRIIRADGTTRLVQSVLQRRDLRSGTLRLIQYDADRRLHNELLDALSGEQFAVVYQPVVEPGSGRVTGAEALIRWQHPHRGRVSPAEFIPYAEASGLIVDVGRWVVRAACREAATWPADMHVAVNLSARQLANEHIVETVAEALCAAGLEPSRLVLEITESALIDNPEQAIRSLTELKSLGLALAIDDFGTGYSSLAYLKQMPVDTLKIDRSFVEGVGKDTGDEAIVNSVLALARAFGLTVVAEGIETEEQRQYLADLGCDLAQGYLWSPPVPPEQFRGIFTDLSYPTGHLGPDTGSAPTDPTVADTRNPAADDQRPEPGHHRCPTCGR